jgi:hypothetical protein
MYQLRVDKYNEKEINSELRATGLINVSIWAIAVTNFAINALKTIIVHRKKTPAKIKLV